LIHAETATFEVRARSQARVPTICSPSMARPFVVQGEPERRDPDRLVWMLDARRP
jgi:hypothetical protein